MLILYIIFPIAILVLGIATFMGIIGLCSFLSSVDFTDVKRGCKSKLGVYYATIAYMKEVIKEEGLKEINERDIGCIPFVSCTLMIIYALPFALIVGAVYLMTTFSGWILITCIAIVMIIIYGAKKILPLYDKFLKKTSEIADKINELKEEK